MCAKTAFFWVRTPKSKSWTNMVLLFAKLYYLCHVMLCHAMVYYNMLSSLGLRYVIVCYDMVWDDV